MFGIGYGKQWSAGQYKTVSVGFSELQVRYTTKISNGFRGVYSSSIGPYLEGNPLNPYDTSSWFIWQDPAGILRYQQITDYPPSPLAGSPSGLGYLNFKDLSSVALAFNQRNSRVISWTLANRSYVDYFNEVQEKETAQWVGYDIVLFFDGIFLKSLDSDVIAFYMNSDRTKVMYRLQKDRYSIEYIYYDLSQPGSLYNNFNFQPGPGPYILDRLEVTDHTFILYVTDRDGRELQMESLSYGFKAADNTSISVGFTEAYLRYIRILDLGLVDTSTVLHAFSHGALKTIIEKAYIVDNISTSYGIGFAFVSQQKVVIEHNDEVSTNFFLAIGNIFSIADRTFYSSDSLQAYTSFFKGDLSVQKILSVSERSILSVTISEGTSKQVRFVADPFYEAIDQSVQLDKGIATNIPRTLIQEEDLLNLSADFVSGDFISTVVTKNSEESTSFTVSFNTGSHEETIKQRSSLESLNNIVSIAFGDLSNSVKAYAYDITGHSLELNYGAHYKSIWSYSYIAALDFDIKPSRGSFKKLGQLSDIVEDYSYIQPSINSGLYKIAALTIKSLNESGFLSISLFGGLATGGDDTEVLEYDSAYVYFVAPDYFGAYLWDELYFAKGKKATKSTYDDAYIYFVAPDSYVGAGNSGYNDSQSAEIMTFLEQK